MLQRSVYNQRFTRKSVELQFKRYKNPPHHWSVLRKKITNADKALSHMNEFYGSAFGERWKDVKEAITRPHKYVALVNNFGDDLETMEHLENIGALNLKDIIEERREVLKYKASGRINIIKNEDTDIDSRIKQIADQLSQEEISQLYGTRTGPSVVDTGTIVLGQQDAEEQETLLESLKDVPAEQLNEDNYDESRLIDGNVGLKSIALWNFVPATKLKGKEDWIPESHQFQFYLGAKDFPVHTEEDDSLDIPQYLNVYSFDMGVKKKFFEPKKGKTGVFNYFLMDGTSILPVLALNPQFDDRVLDLCASPGGKTLAILQTMMPKQVVANDAHVSRINRIHKVMREYLFDYNTNEMWKEKLCITQQDGNSVKDDLGFDKVLVDVPCTSDRHSVRESTENIFHMNRIKERLRLPEIQSSLLCNALNLCKIGGTVVYSTCTLSPLQNDGVIQVALKKAYEKHKIEATVKLFTNSILPFRGLFQLGEGTLSTKFGHLIVPHVNSNFGPAYFAKIVRNK